MGWFDDNPYQDASGNPIHVGGGLGTSAGLPPGAQNLGRIGTQPVGGGLMAPAGNRITPPPEGWGSEGPGGLSGRNQYPGFLLGEPDPSGQGFPWPAQQQGLAGGGNPTDRDFVRSQLAQIMQARGIQPGGRGSGPADLEYYTDQALATGGWTPDNAGYWTDRWNSDASGGGQGGQTGLNGPFGATPFNFQYNPNDPSYAFVRDQAMRGVQQGAAARGTLNTGGTLKDLQDRAAGLASQEYGNEFQRQYQTNALNFNQGLAANQNQFGQNFNLANLGLNANIAGLNAAGNLASNASSYANTAQNNVNNQSGLFGDIGNAQAAGTLGRNAAWSGLYGDLGNLARSRFTY